MSARESWVARLVGSLPHPRLEVTLEFSLQGSELWAELWGGKDPARKSLCKSPEAGKYSPSELSLGLSD